MNNKKYTLEEFITKSNLKHKNKYSYEKSIYVNNSTKIIITCEKHGDFLQRPYDHQKGNGCKFCHFEKTSERQLLTIDNFIEKANRIFNNKFDYSKFIYTHGRDKSTIICPEHGEFIISAHFHLQGDACSKCSKSKRAKSHSLTLKEFIDKANLIHNYKYDYSKVNYTNNKENVEIICPIHGSFLQQPDNHLLNMGCKKCFYDEAPGGYASVFKHNPEFELYLYHFELTDKNGFTFYKIGLSINPEERLKEMRGLYGRVLETKQGKIKNLYPLEQKYHEIFKEFGIQYKPIELQQKYTSGYTECYKW